MRISERVLNVRLETGRYRLLQSMAADAGLSPDQYARVLLTRALDDATANARLAILLEQLSAPSEALPAGDSGRRSAPKSATGAATRGNRRAGGRDDESKPSASLHDEIAAVLREHGRPMATSEIAAEIRRRQAYNPPRSGKPITGSVVSRRVSNARYRSLFERGGRKVWLTRSDAVSPS